MAWTSRGSGGFGERGFQRRGFFGGGGGGNRGRGGGSGRPAAPMVDLRKLFENLNTEPIKTWNVKAMADSVNESGDRPFKVADRKLVASYNWDKKSEEPRIVLPGAPKLFFEWTGGDLSGCFGEEREIPEDRNLDAMFAAVRIMEPKFKLSEYDIVGDLVAITGLFHICLQVVNTIRARSGHIPVGAFESAGRDDDSKLRIDVQVVGSTLLMVRQEQELEPAGGVGMEFRRVCAKPPPLSMMRGEQLDDGLVTGVFKMVQGITLGNRNILMVDEVEAARYPSEGTGPVEPLAVLEDISVKVAIGGFKGDLNTLTPIAFASRSARATNLHPGKWLKQYLCGTQYRYVGRHYRGVFNDQPNLNTLDEIRSMCDFDSNAADLWVKVLERVLGEIVFFARCYDPGTTAGETGRKLAIIADPDRRQLSIHEYADGGDETEIVSKKTLDYLMSTLE